MSELRDQRLYCFDEKVFLPFLLSGVIFQVLVFAYNSDLVY